MTSAYPAPVDDLIPQAQALAVKLGEVPSRNRLMAELKVGAPKARAVLAALTDAGFDPTTTDPATTNRRLHAVPAETTTEPDTHSPAAVVDPAPPAVPAPASTPATGDHEPAVNGHASTDADPGTPPEQVQGWARRLWQRRPNGTPATTAGRVAPANPARAGRARSWPVLLLALPAFVAIWSGWVGLGGLTGFGIVHPLPGIWDSFELNTAITLPIGVETYAAYALRVWLAGGVPRRARNFARWSAIASLVLGAAGQVAYHLMTAVHMTTAPWQITTVVACLPVAVLGMGAALAHLLHSDEEA